MNHVHSFLNTQIPGPHPTSTELPASGEGPESLYFQKTSLIRPTGFGRPQDLGEFWELPQEECQMGPARQGLFCRRGITGLKGWTLGPLLFNWPDIC